MGRSLGSDLAVLHRSLEVLPRFAPNAGAYGKRTPRQRRSKKRIEVHERVPPLLQILRIEHQLQLTGLIGGLLRAGRWPSRGSQRADRTLPQSAVS